MFFVLLISCRSALEVESFKTVSETTPFPREPAESISAATVGPLLSTEWGQGGVWQSQTPMKEGAQTYPGCTSVATAQILYYYQHQNYASKDKHCL